MAAAPPPAVDADGAPMNSPESPSRGFVARYRRSLTDGRRLSLSGSGDKYAPRDADESDRGAVCAASEQQQSALRRLPNVAGIFGAHVCIYLSAMDLVRLSASCRALHHAVNNSPLVWRTLLACDFNVDTDALDGLNKESHQRVGIAPARSTAILRPRDGDGVRWTARMSAMLEPSALEPSMIATHPTASSAPSSPLAAQRVPNHDGASRDGQSEAGAGSPEPLAWRGAEDDDIDLASCIRIVQDAEPQYGYRTLYTTLYRSRVVGWLRRLAASRQTAVSSLRMGSLQGAIESADRLVNYQLQAGVLGGLEEARLTLASDLASRAALHLLRYRVLSESVTDAPVAATPGRSSDVLESRWLDRAPIGAAAPTAANTRRVQAPEDLPLVGSTLGRSPSAAVRETPQQQDDWINDILSVFSAKPKPSSPERAQHAAGQANSADGEANGAADDDDDDDDDFCVHSRGDDATLAYPDFDLCPPPLDVSSADAPLAPPTCADLSAFDVEIEGNLWRFDLAELRDAVPAGADRRSAAYAAAHACLCDASCALLLADSGTPLHRRVQAMAVESCVVIGPGCFLQPGFVFEYEYDHVNLTGNVLVRSGFLFGYKFWCGPSFTAYFHEYLVCDSLKCWPERIIIHARRAASTEAQRAIADSWAAFDKRMFSQSVADATRAVSLVRTPCTCCLDAPRTRFLCPVNTATPSVCRIDPTRLFAHDVPFHATVPDATSDDACCATCGNHLRLTMSEATAFFTLGYTSQYADTAVRGYITYALYHPVVARRAVAFNNIGSLLMQLKEYDIALNWLLMCSRYNPRYYMAYRNIAKCQRKQQHADAALATMTSAIRLCFWVPGEAYSERSRYQPNNHAAFDDLATAQRVNPLYSAAYRNRAMLLRDAHRMREAVREITAIIEIKCDPQDLLVRAMLHQQLGQKANAYADMRLAFALDPGNAAISKWVRQRLPKVGPLIPEL